MITADLDQQLHGWSIDAIDDNDGRVVCLQKLEKHVVGDDVTTVAVDPLTMSNRHERGVVITVGINDSTGFEILKVIGFCDGDEFSRHSRFSFVLEGTISGFRYVAELVNGYFEMWVIGEFFDGNEAREIG